MFSLDEVIIIALTAALIVGYLSFKVAQYLMIARMLASLSESELDRLDKLKAQLEAALNDEEADKIIANASRENSVTLTQEVVDGNVYLYDSTGTFVAQGASAQEAATNFITSQHSHSRATVKCDGGKSYQIVDGRIQS